MLELEFAVPSTEWKFLGATEESFESVVRGACSGTLSILFSELRREMNLSVDVGKYVLVGIAEGYMDARIEQYPMEVIVRKFGFAWISSKPTLLRLLKSLQEVVLDNITLCVLLGKFLGFVQFDKDGKVVHHAIHVDLIVKRFKTRTKNVVAAQTYEPIVQRAYNSLTGTNKEYQKVYRDKKKNHLLELTAEASRLREDAAAASARAETVERESLMQENRLLSGLLCHMMDSKNPLRELMHKRAREDDTPDPRAEFADTPLRHM